MLLCKGSRLSTLLLSMTLECDLLVKCFDFTASREHEKQIQMIKLINKTFWFSFLCRKLDSLRQQEETKLSWCVLITLSLITDLTPMAQTQPVTIKFPFLPGGEAWEGLMKTLKWEGESFIPVRFLCHSPGLCFSVAIWKNFPGPSWPEILRNGTVTPAASNAYPPSTWTKCQV